jgi:hypothetical protein
VPRWEKWLHDNLSKAKEALKRRRNRKAMRDFEAKELGARLHE